MNELLTRFKEPLNDFWKRALLFFGTLTAVAVTVTELLPQVYSDAMVPEEYKPTVRIIYSIALGFSIAAKLTRK